MSRISCNLVLLLTVVLGLVGSAFATPTLIGSTTITGGEQVSSGGVSDTGTVTATFNGISVSIAYGQFSTPAAVASALAAKISQKCSFPVYAHAAGAVINFYKKGANVLNSATISSTSSNPSLFPGNSFLVAGGGSWSPPQIDHLSMTEGPIGMGVIIYGSNVGSARGSVMIGNIAATIVSWSTDGTQIIVQVPTGLAAGSIPYDVVVETSTWWAFNTGTSTFQVDDAWCN